MNTTTEDLLAYASYVRQLEQVAKAAEKLLADFGQSEMFELRYEVRNLRHLKTGRGAA